MGSNALARQWNVGEVRNLFGVETDCAIKRVWVHVGKGPRVGKDEHFFFFSFGGEEGGE